MSKKYILESIKSNIVLGQSTQYIPYILDNKNKPYEALLKLKESINK